MDTLYDLLGALPHDDAESLRTAFRRAVKGAHPDIRPGDPDAAVRFRQIVRANEILCDKDQRAAYDHLLALAQLEKDPASAHPIAARVHKIASTVLALTSISIATVGGYFLFMHMSMALVAPTGSLAASRTQASTIDLTARLSASIAAVSPTDAPDPAAVSAFIAAKTEGAGATNVANAMAMASADAESAAPSGIATPDPASDLATIAQARDVAALGSSVLGSSALGSSSLANGDVGAVAVNPDQVTQLEQKFTAPYVDRGILFFRENKDDRGFPDLAPLKRSDKPGHPKSLLAANGKAHPGAVPKVVPLPQPRTWPRFVRPQPWYASATFQ
jgi:hypothetical protein